LGVLTVHGTQFELDGKPFCYHEPGFFHALYSAAFSRDDDQGHNKLRYFLSWRITALPVWGDRPMSR
jgi:hypothetical protein